MWPSLYFWHKRHPIKLRQRGGNFSISGTYTYSPYYTLHSPLVSLLSLCKRLEVLGVGRFIVYRRSARFTRRRTRFSTCRSCRRGALLVLRQNLRNSSR